MDTKIPRNDDGSLSAYAWPGGYPLLYITADGGVLCPDCANGANGSEASEDAEPRSGWKLDGVCVHYEGPAEPCDHCGAEVESAYGDPDSDD